MRLLYSIANAHQDVRMPHMEYLKKTILTPLNILQVIGAFAWGASWIANPYIDKNINVSMLVSILGVVLVVLVNNGRKSLTLWRVSGLLYMVLLTILFKIEIVRMEANSSMWSVLVTSMLLTGMSVFFINFLDYLLASVLVWCLMWDVNVVSVGSNLNLYYVFVVSCVALGVHTNITFIGSIKVACKARDDFKKLSETDPLTNAPNRRALIQSLEWFLAAKQVDKIWFVMVDIDDFKKINDTFGHEAGDLVLIDFAKKILLSPGLLQFGRLGGEEFGLIFTAINIEEVARGLYDLISVSKNSTSGSSSFSFSCGVAQVNFEDSVAEVLKKADLNLYAAKKHGKECVFFDDNVVLNDCKFFE